MVCLTARTRPISHRYRPRRCNSRVIGVPAFMDAQNLQKFINQELIDRISKVEYLNINGKNQEGYDATILP